MDSRAERAGTGAESVTTVICAFSLERFEQTLTCVQSVLDQVPLVPSIVVVVDHNERLERKLREALDSTVRVVPSRGPRGLSVARNTGIEHATGDTIAFLDDDAFAAPDWLATLREVLAEPDVFAVGGHAVPIWSGRAPAHFPEEFLWVVGCSYRGLRRRGSVRNTLGCNMAFRAWVFAEVGGFDPAIGRLGKQPLGCEETELCIRASRRHPDGVFLYEPRARVHHRVPPQRGRWSYFRSRCYAEGRSKALVARVVGPRRALAAERVYARKVLLRGVGRGLADCVVRRDPAGLGRAGAIVSGLLITTAGYVVGSASLGPRREGEAAPLGAPVPAAGGCR